MVVVEPGLVVGRGRWWWEGRGLLLAERGKGRALRVVRMCPALGSRQLTLVAGRQLAGKGMQAQLLWTAAGAAAGAGAAGAAGVEKQEREVGVWEAVRPCLPLPQTPQGRACDGEGLKTRVKRAVGCDCLCLVACLPRGCPYPPCMLVGLRGCCPPISWPPHQAHTHRPCCPAAHPPCPVAVVQVAVVQAVWWGWGRHSASQPFDTASPHSVCTGSRFWRGWLRPPDCRGLWLDPAPRFRVRWASSGCLVHPRPPLHAQQQQQQRRVTWGQSRPPGPPCYQVQLWPASLRCHRRRC